jgi:putative Holliday junction resolvase
LTGRAPRVLAVDLGTVRVGLALSDPLGLTAQPAGKIARRSLRDSLEPLLAIVRAHDVATVVVGHPLLMSGEAGTRAKDAETFVARLRAELSCPVVLWDERLTSVQANRALLEGDVSRRKRRDVVDAAAAALLLQSWLDAQPPPG